MRGFAGLGFVFFLIIFFSFDASLSINAYHRDRKVGHPYDRVNGNHDLNVTPKYFNPHLNHASSTKSSASQKQNSSPTKSSPSHGVVFDVLNYGAKGNGIADDTEALFAAWAKACETKSSTMLIPSGYQFLVGPISFAGPCQPQIVFQVDGSIIAANMSSKLWNSSSPTQQWLKFTKITQGIKLEGSGVIEGHGEAWWAMHGTHFDQADDDEEEAAAAEPVRGEEEEIMPSRRPPPAALRFYGSYDVRVRGIRIQNSPRCHLKFDSCVGVHVTNIAVSSPADSPNTDAIHLQNSVDVDIRHCNLSCGDDCISIQTGSSNVHIQNVTCGPGHGISIGSLGEDRTKAFISNVTVEHVYMIDTLAGVRIKTWQGGSGSVKNVKFSNVRVSNVKTPIVIDQYYSDGKSCKNQSSAVSLSQIFYDTIIGTYTAQPVYLACSDNNPCKNLSITNLRLKPAEEGYHVRDPFCWKAYGEVHAPIIPPINCLRKETTIKKSIIMG